MVPLIVVQFLLLDMRLAIMLLIEDAPLLWHMLHVFIEKLDRATDIASS